MQDDSTIFRLDDLPWHIQVFAGLTCHRYGKFNAARRPAPGGKQVNVIG